jgi:hypothetical protein
MKDERRSSLDIRVHHAGHYDVKNDDVNKHGRKSIAHNVASLDEGSRMAVFISNSHVNTVPPRDDRGLQKLLLWLDWVNQPNNGLQYRLHGW